MFVWARIESTPNSPRCHRNWENDRGCHVLVVVVAAFVPRKTVVVVVVVGVFVVAVWVRQASPVCRGQ